MKDLDGWRKNLAKLRSEWAYVWEALKYSGESHDPYVNAWVECCRASPYFMGHLGAFVTPILIILAVWGWAT